MPPALYPSVIKKGAAGRGGPLDHPDRWKSFGGIEMLRPISGCVGLLVVLYLTGCSFYNYDPKDDHTVEAVDLKRYQGRWHEIASLPAGFQRGCVCTTADYKLVRDHVVVINTCRDGSPQGKIRRARGKAYPVGGSNNSRLEVVFFWPFRGNYWVIGLDRDYQWVMVGHPKRKYLWIMSRKPFMAESLYTRLKNRARALGYPVDKLKKMDQSCYRRPKKNN
jgi:apolipoprotein D and lipocalin family protein